MYSEGGVEAEIFKHTHFTGFPSGVSDSITKSKLDLLRYLKDFHLVLLNEADECRPLYLNGLTGAVVEGDHKVEKIRLPQI